MLTFPSLCTFNPPICIGSTGEPGVESSACRKTLRGSKEGIKADEGGSEGEVWARIKWRVDNNMYCRAIMSMCT